MKLWALIAVSFSLVAAACGSDEASGVALELQDYVDEIEARTTQFDEEATAAAENGTSSMGS